MASEIDSEIAMPPMRIGEPAWAIAKFFPRQGFWSDEDYFRLETEHFVELTNGCIEVLPMPTPLHQLIVMWLSDQLKIWNRIKQFGTVFVAPVPLKLPSGDFREPDVLIVPKSSATRQSRNLSSAMFVLEVVSEGAENRNRDYVVKRDVYAKAGIPEYWIVDPEEKSVTALKLVGSDYVTHGRFAQNEIAYSATLEGFSINCGEMWEVEKEL
jgi:Uma2 family endonuclease